MRTQTKGKCKYCGREYTKSYMLRHLSTCKDRKEVLDGESGVRMTGYYELALSGKYNNQYWLIIEIRGDALLKDLDQFIRDIWVECCGHLSAFDIDGVRYESDPDDFWGEPVEDLNHKLSSILRMGTRIEYEYDFGSTTELLIEVKGFRMGVWKKDKVVILSRNAPIERMCSICGKRPAAYIDVFRFYEEGDGLFCEECLEDGDEEYEYLSEVCNSPRMGVCGYAGSEKYPDVFVPDKS